VGSAVSRGGLARRSVASSPPVFRRVGAVIDTSWQCFFGVLGIGLHGALVLLESLLNTWGAMGMDYRLGLRLLVLALSLFASCLSCVPEYETGRRYESDSDIFYEALSPYGHWVDHDIYGRVWYPADVPLGWRPYSDGHWEYSRDYGWVWASDREWGWAPFHYGRWAFDDWYGWVWVPGREWAPAWVVWRYGGGYAAWAPMPPTAVWHHRRGLDRRYFSYERDLDWDCWVGVPERHLHDREMPRHVIGQRDNIRMLGQTTTVVQVIAVNNRVVNQGVPVESVEKTVGKPIPRVHLHEVDRPDAGGKPRSSDELRAVRLHVPPQSGEDIRREEERAMAVSRQQERRRQEPRQEEAEPRKAGRLLNVGNQPDKKAAVPQEAPPSAPAGRVREDAPRPQPPEAVTQKAQPGVAEGKKSTDTKVGPSVTTPGVLPPDGAPRSGAAGEQEGAVRRSEQEVPKAAPPQKGEPQKLGGQAPPAAVAPPETPAAPAVQPKGEQALPKAQAEPPADASQRQIPAPEVKQQPRAVPPPAAEEAGVVLGGAVQTSVQPRPGATEPAQDSKGGIGAARDDAAAKQGRAGEQEGRHGTPDLRLQVEQPVRPISPEPPRVEQPKAPVVPEVIPQHMGDQPRRDLEREPLRREVQQPALEAMPERQRQTPPQGQQMGGGAQPSGQEGRPDDQGKRKKKPRQPGDPQEQEADGERQGKPQP